MTNSPVFAVQIVAFVIVLSLIGQAIGAAV